MATQHSRKPAVRSFNVTVPDGPFGDMSGTIDAPAELRRLGLEEHLSAQRSNGLRAMVERIRLLAAAA